MTTEAIIESGMTFGPYPEGTCFYIEKSTCYQSIQTGIKIAEFILLKDDTLWIVEAKSSVPKEFDGYLAEIETKLKNAFELSLAIRLKRHSQTCFGELSEKIQKTNLAKQTVKLVLVIRGVPEEHLISIQDALSKKMRMMMKLWAIKHNSVMVLNDAGAKTKGLIL
jgi:hypothetical protein